MNEHVSTILVGISACLTGASVRYDGHHKYSSVCVEELGRLFTLVPVCPEMGIGLGAPREPIRLLGQLASDDVRVRGVYTPTLDVTEALQAYAEQKATELSQLSGYIFMERSPSCGLQGIPVHDEQGVPLDRFTMGVFAREFLRLHPDLPRVEASSLLDPRVREDFIARVYAHKRQ